MTAGAGERMLGDVKSQNQKTALLLDNAVDLMFEIHVMRRDCCLAARSFSGKGHADGAALEDCARLEESLAKAYRMLQSTLQDIQFSRAKRGKPAA
jgi:hypothetical protein